MAVSAIFVEFNYVLFLIHIKNGKKSILLYYYP